ncbi:hypothetical protein OEB99_02585 [Actinotalea sp. M2MS4P-6]|uniref:hypothetical protein n=1 Tax=Actinotalea sp. M2MS4P-6 TaxID=2983762 RepID=UPI0021E3944F|nr:hypothetical protein [Actinotalea sp. M2MS4P-6]MCV2393184.1 hypothetical protein [Actinotalea sp. M2MS4P-6]
MSIAHLGEPTGLETASTRRAVRAERAEVVRWRRLLRARLDLLVASFAPPEPLGAMGWDVLPDAQLRLPSSEELHQAIAEREQADRVTAMRQLRVLDRRLSAYADELDRALEQSTESLVMALVAEELDRPDARD